jgi:hypothetical protein
MFVLGRAAVCLDAGGLRSFGWLWRHSDGLIFSMLGGGRPLQWTFFSTSQTSTANEHLMLWVAVKRVLLGEGALNAVLVRLESCLTG